VLRALDPIAVHATWYPTCPFLLQLKGIEYITNQRRINGTSERPVPHHSNRVFNPNDDLITSQHRTAETYTTYSTNHQSLITIRASGETSPPSGGASTTQQGPTFVNTSFGSATPRTFSGDVITPRPGNLHQETFTLPGVTITNITDASSHPPPARRKRKGIKLRRQTVIDAMNTPTTRQVLTMGFDPESVRKAVTRRIELIGFSHSSNEDLVNDVLEVESIRQQTSFTDPRVSGLVCTMCNYRVIEVVFIPCGHYCACQACADVALQCPRCNQAFTSVVKVQTS